MNTNVKDGVTSPCISVCKLDARNICVGCWRTLEEIAAWSKMSDQQKNNILENCLARSANTSTSLDFNLTEFEREKNALP